MRSIGLVILCVVLTTAVCFSIAVSEDLEELCIPLQTLVIEPLSGAEQQRASVEFPHGTHFNYACQRCHHTWNGREEIKNCTTSGCHDQLATPKQSDSDMSPEALALTYYKKAYHQLCIGCHKQIKQQNKQIELSKKPITTALAKTGPTGCIECHPKEKK